MNYFLCYSRDELFKFVDEKEAVELIKHKISLVNSNNENVYFDDLKNDGITIPAIFANIEKFLSQEQTILILMSNSPICYGWAERELLKAIEFGKEIRIIRIDRLLKVLRKNSSTIEDIYRSSKCLFNENSD